MVGTSSSNLRACPLILLETGSGTDDMYMYRSGTGGTYKINRSNSPINEKNLLINPFLKFIIYTYHPYHFYTDTYHLYHFYTLRKLTFLYTFVYVPWIRLTAGTQPKHWS